VSKAPDKNEDTTLSIEDIERVVSSQIKQQTQIQKNHLLSVITDIDKDKTRLMLALGELKISLLEEIQKSQKELRSDIQRELEGLKGEIKEKERKREKDGENCKTQCSKQVYDIQKNQKEFSEKINTTLERQKPNYFAIIPLIVLLTSPFAKWFFELHGKINQNEMAVSLLELQQKSLLEKQIELKQKLEKMGKEDNNSSKNFLATSTTDKIGD